jgi:DNA sulfur modification protein DndD
VSLALAGRDLRLRARDRLKQEAVREEWEAGRKQGEAGLERFTGLMAEGMQTMAPPLDQGHRDAVLRLVLESWDALWHPAPAGTAPDFRHEYAKGADRARVLEALERVEHVSNESVLGLLKEIGRRDGERQKLENEIGQLEGISPQIEAKATELRSLNGTIDKLSVERGSLERSHDGISSQLGQKRQELARSTQSFQNAAPKLRLATTADRVAEVIDRIIQQAVPHQIAAVAESMTRAFRAMSHKKIVDRVEIDVNCGVRLLSSSGRDIREMAASAGEQQIFVQALISAISEVSKRNFPIMIDTPLGRLDDQHRFGVLKYFTDRPGQVILLSTDTEVVGPYLDVIKPRLAATYHIRHEHDGDIGRSYIERGYFPETRA